MGSPSMNQGQDDRCALAWNVLCKSLLSVWGIRVPAWNAEYSWRYPYPWKVSCPVDFRFFLKKYIPLKPGLDSDPDFDVERPEEAAGQMAGRGGRR